MGVLQRFGNQFTSKFSCTAFVHILQDSCSTMLIAALLIVSRIWKQPRCPSTEELKRISPYLHFRGLVHYLHGETHGDMQADMALEKELRIYILLHRLQEVKLPHQAQLEYMRMQRFLYSNTLSLMRPHPLLLQQCHTSSRKTKLIPTKLYLLIVSLPMG